MGGSGRAGFRRIGPSCGAGTNNAGAILTSDRFSNIDSAYNFDGTDDYISLDTLPSLANKSFTISIWCKRGALNNSHYLFALLGSLTTISNFYFGFWNDNAIRVDFGNSWLDTPTTLITETTTWHHVLVSYNSGTQLKKFRCSFIINPISSAETGLQK